ncbi:MAG: PQQ-dependent sugar dehydrogenase, partial [Terriglobales bacterium]
MKPFLSDLMNATGIAFDRQGRMYVTSRYEGAVYRVTPNGAKSTYAEGMGIATGLAFDRNQNLYVGDRSGTIFKIAPDQQIFVFATLEPSIAAYHLAFAPDGRLFFNELDTGRVRIIQNGLLVAQPFIDLAVDTHGERGLLGLALHPQFATNGFVYVLYSDPAVVHRVLRFTEVSGVGTNQTVIVDNLPSNSNHNGGNIRFGPDGRLYITTGDSGDPANSQDPNSRAGKILRYNADGSVPGDNPFGAGNPAFNLGLRNSFDFTFHPTSGTIYASENGPACDDEINRIVAGGNYGWRPGQPCGDTDPAFIQPLIRFTPTIAPTGITFYTSSILPAFQGSLFMVDFNEGRVRRFVVNDAAPGQI